MLFANERYGRGQTSVSNEAHDRGDPFQKSLASGSKLHKILCNALPKVVSDIAQTCPKSDLSKGACTPLNHPHLNVTHYHRTT